MDGVMSMSTRNRNQAGNISVPPAGQKGAVLLIALIVLIAMTLSALALIRSVNTTNLISGNLAFRESAVLSAEHSTEVALNWLKTHAVLGDTVLHVKQAGNGYFARRDDPEKHKLDGDACASGDLCMDWDSFWAWMKDAGNSDRVDPVTIPSDSAGNTASYIIHRLCEFNGNPEEDATKCSKPPLSFSGDSFVAGGDSLGLTHQVYYRITTRVVGPRNTVAYTQTIVAL
jgi:hypothetical protein